MRGKYSTSSSVFEFIFFLFATFQYLVIQAELTYISIHTLTHGELRLDVTCCLQANVVSLTRKHLKSPLQSFLFLYKLKYKKL